MFQNALYVKNMMLMSIEHIPNVRKMQVTYLVPIKWFIIIKSLVIVLLEVVMYQSYRSRNPQS